MPALGLLARVAYRLSRQRILRLPLDIAIVLVAAAALLYALGSALFSGRLPLSPALLAGAGLWAGASIALRLRAFIVFLLEMPETPTGRLGAAKGRLEAAKGGYATGGLRPFRPIAVRASGFFEVGDERRYYVQAPGKLEATELGERILMVQVPRVSLLGLFPSADEEWGWWYAFFRPEEVKAVTPGDLHFGWRPRPALRLDFGPARPPAYLTFDDPTARDLALADLAPAPAGSLAPQ